MEIINKPKRTPLTPVRLATLLDRNVYAVLGNELGVQVKKDDWRAGDVALFTH